MQLGTGLANGVPQGDNPDFNVTTRGPGSSKSVKFNPELVERVDWMKAVAQAQSAVLQTNQESLKAVISKLIFQDVIINDPTKRLNEVEEAIYDITEIK